MGLRFDGRYFSIALVSLAIGALVATALRQYSFIRGSVSDVIATLFVFFALLCFVRTRHTHLAAFTLCFAFSLEFGQLFGLADRLGLARGSVLSILFGNTFSLADLAYYALGVCISLLITSKLVPEKSMP